MFGEVGMIHRKFYSILNVSWRMSSLALIIHRDPRSHRTAGEGIQLRELIQLRIEVALARAEFLIDEGSHPGEGGRGGGGSTDDGESLVGGATVSVLATALRTRNVAVVAGRRTEGEVGDVAHIVVDRARNSIVGLPGRLGEFLADAASGADVQVEDIGIVPDTLRNVGECRRTHIVGIDRARPVQCSECTVVSQISAVISIKRGPPHGSDVLRTGGVVHGRRWGSG